MQPIEAVLFDFGMVLSRPPVPAVWAEMRRVAGLDEDTLHRLYWAHRDEYDSGALSGTQYWERIAADSGRQLTPEQRHRLLALDVDLWTDINPPMLAWVRRLHSSGFRTGILSNMPDAMAEGICRKFEWLADFHYAVWSHALRLRKPDLEIYVAATKGLGVAAGAILFIDDKEENIRAAESFGMQAILYSDHKTFETEMVARGLDRLLHPEPESMNA